MREISLAVIALFCSLHLSAAPAKPKLAEQYRKWLEQDVVYIITDEERKEFLALNNDDEREKFMVNFWDQCRNHKAGLPKKEFPAKDEPLRSPGLCQRALRPRIQLAWLEDLYVPILDTFRGSQITPSLYRIQPDLSLRDLVLRQQDQLSRFTLVFLSFVLRGWRHCRIQVLPSVYRRTDETGSRLAVQFD